MPLISTLRNYAQMFNATESTYELLNVLSSVDAFNRAVQPFPDMRIRSVGGIYGWGEKRYTCTNRLEELIFEALSARRYESLYNQAVALLRENTQFVKIAIHLAETFETLDDRTVEGFLQNGLTNVERSMRSVYARTVLFFLQNIKHDHFEGAKQCLHDMVDRACDDMEVTVENLKNVESNRLSLSSLSTIASDECAGTTTIRTTRKRKRNED